MAHGATANISQVKQVPKERNKQMKRMTYERVICMSLFIGTVMAFALWEWVPYLVFAVVMLTGLSGVLAIYLYQANQYATQLQATVALYLAQSATPARRRPTRVSWSSAELRIGDVERDQCLSELTDHYAAGRLDLDEFGRRQDLTLKAITGKDLRMITNDLPEPQPPRVVYGNRNGVIRR